MGLRRVKFKATAALPLTRCTANVSSNTYVKQSEKMYQQTSLHLLKFPQTSNAINKQEGNYYIQNIIDIKSAGLTWDCKSKLLLFVVLGCIFNYLLKIPLHLHTPVRPNSCKVLCIQTHSLLYSCRRLVAQVCRSLKDSKMRHSYEREPQTSSQECEEMQDIDGTLCGSLSLRR